MASKNTFFMVSKNQIKAVAALHLKKNRQSSRRFIAEGAKVIGELLRAGFSVEALFVTEPLFPEVSESKKYVVSEADLRKMSALTAANNCLAVFEMPKPEPIGAKGLIVALDDVRDPGNLGTIVRLCDWFGVRHVVCSMETAELYNPKAVQATMGSLARVNVVHTDLAAFLSEAKLPVFGTFMDGENIYSQKLPQEGIVIFGNEANGISPEVEKLVTQKIAIPRFGDLQKTESLNVAAAAAIVLSEFRRK
jgi:TrmH family RNA methyltransferase